MDRRDFLTTSLATSAALLTVPAGAQPPSGASAAPGRLKQSVCRWCFGRMPLDDLCREAAGMGIASVELLNPDEWDVPRKHGITCALASNVKSNPIHSGFNRLENHDAIIRDLEERLPLVAAAGIPQQIVFSGNREPGAAPGDAGDREGLKHCAAGLKRITPLAERLGVTLVMELLNSRVDHKGYQCDRTPWGVELVRQVGSPRFKLLYDIYHMQIMEGDVIRTITGNLEHIGHFHTAGVPGRHELDGGQELHYPAICRAIADKGFDGFLAQEFMPTRDPMTSLSEAVAICTV